MVTCTTPPFRAAVRLNSGVSAQIMTPRNFRLLIFSSLLLGIVGSAVDYVVPGLVPQPLATQIEDQSFNNLGSWIIPVLIASALLLVAGVTATIGLLLFKHWSRPLAVLVTVLGIFLCPFLGAMLVSGLYMTIFSLSSMLWAAGLVFSYTAPLSARFVKPGR